MNRRTALLSLCLTVAAGWAVAEPHRLTAAEIATLLTDKTIDGDWNGTAYSQSFDASGQTLYSPVGGRSEIGRWRVNADTDMYESFWERSGWSAYAIERETDGTLMWVYSAGRNPFTVRAE